MRCHCAGPVTSSIFASASCTRFSPSRRKPAARASRQTSTPNPFVTATIATSSGFRPVAAMRALTRASRSWRVGSLPGGENRGVFRSFDCNDRAESLAVWPAAMRRKEVVLLRTHADLVDLPRAAGLELHMVGGGKVEQEPVAGGCHESRVELGGNLLTDLVAAAADAGPDAGPDVAASVPVPEALHSRPGDPGPRAAPAGVHQAGDSLLRVP